MSALRRIVCKYRGHRWEFTGMEYEQGEAWATDLHGENRQRVAVTWVHDETCARCGCESWWPS